MILYHLTCDHGAAGIERDGEIHPTRTPRSLWPEPVVWLTTSTSGSRQALGLTSTMLTCDRTAHLFRVRTDDAIPWAEYKARMATWKWQSLEAARGTRPQLWWLSLSALTEFERIK